MKVFDLHCPQAHVFEGWFGSEADFRSQLERGLVQCPLCGSTELRKGLSAPRLNLGATPPSAAPAAPRRTAPASAPAAAVPVAAAPQAPLPPEAREQLHALQAAWLKASREIAAKTEDVGTHFADQARRMHHGQEPERPIRGQATPQQTMELLEDGVPVLPLALPPGSQETLQ